MTNTNDLIFTIESETGKTEDKVKKMQKKIISKTTENVKRIIDDKLSGRMGEC